jgi:ribosomal protein S12 methylthiotransferase accessory factor
MEMIVGFPGGARVNVQFGSFIVETDQPKPGGDGAAPTPFEMFLASMATCAGAYIVGFCQKRGIPTAGIKLIQTVDRDSATKMVTKVRQEIQLPPDFPSQYASAVIKAAEGCLVKKHLDHPPIFEVTAKQ